MRAMIIASAFLLCAGYEQCWLAGKKPQPDNLVCDPDIIQETPPAKDDRNNDYDLLRWLIIFGDQ